MKNAINLVVSAVILMFAISVIPVIGHASNVVEKVVHSHRIVASFEIGNEMYL